MSAYFTSAGRTCMVAWPDCDGAPVGFHTMCIWQLGKLVKVHQNSCFFGLSRCYWAQSHALHTLDNDA